MSKRKILTTIIIPAILISALIIVIINNQQDTSGELVLSSQELDFGTVPEWKGKVTREITAKNTGKQPISIRRIQVGYSFVQIEGPTRIQPESTVKFMIHFTPPVLPPNQTTATSIFFTDSPKTPQVYLTINALVERFATLSAEVCDFGNIEPETDYEKKVRLCANAPMDQDKIRLMPSGNPMLSWEMEPDVNSECNIIRIKLKISRKENENDESEQYSQSTPFSALLTIAFPNDRTLTLPIIARVVPPVLAQPESLSYGIITEDISPSLEFTLSAKNTFTILNIAAPEHLQIIVTSVSEESEETGIPYKYRFSVSLDISKSPSLLREEILVTTTATHEPVRIPIYGHIKRDLQTSPSSDSQNEE